MFLINLDAGPPVAHPRNARLRENAGLPSARAGARLRAAGSATRSASLRSSSPARRRGSEARLPRRHLIQAPSPNSVAENSQTRGNSAGVTCARFSGADLVAHATQQRPCAQSLRFDEISRDRYSPRR
jgi:hypothetical protein